MSYSDLLNLETPIASIQLTKTISSEKIPDIITRIISQEPLLTPKALTRAYRQARLMQKIRNKS